MKKLIKHEEACIKCHACEEICSKTYFKEVNVEKSRIQINEEITEEKNWTINVCDQCGECIEVCSELALSRNKAGVVMLDKSKCVGCLMCVGFCPTLSMKIHDDVLEPFKCIACGLCVKECPTNAIEITKASEEAAATKK